jgi:ketosteroid isomerase-like protein
LTGTTLGERVEAGGASMKVSHDLDAVVEQCHHALDEFFKGNPEPFKVLYSRRDDITLGNPFGPFATGWDQVEATMERAASHYRDGRVVGFDHVAKRVTPDLAYTVEVERFEVKVGGSDEITPVALRCTTVYRPEDGAWKVVHRHADPITTARAAESVIQK